MFKIKKLYSFFTVALLLFLTGCTTGIPDNVQPVSGFDAARYVGKWYEIARLDHSFERGLIDVYAVYKQNPDGSIGVENFGYDSEKKEWQSVEGKAYFLESPDTGRLKVTFFWPFYGAYNIIVLDKKNYSYAMVCSYNKSYLWILARDKSLDKKILDSLLLQAKALGFDTSKLIYPQK